MNTQIVIKDNSTLAEVRDLLTRHFSNIDLKFFRYQSLREKAFKDENLVNDSSKTLRDIRYTNLRGDIYIKEALEISGIQNGFRKNGLDILIKVEQAQA